MKKRISFILVLFFGLFAFEAQAELSIDITGARSEPMAVAMPDFAGNNEKAKEQDVLTVDLAVGERQIARLNKMKENRDNAAVKAALEKLRAAAKGTENLMPYLIDAVKTYATLGEICGVLREEFGEFKPSIYY